MASLDATQYQDFSPHFLSMGEPDGVVDDDVPLAVLAPNARLHTVGEPYREVDINVSHVSLVHANETPLRAAIEELGSTGTIFWMVGGEGTEGWYPTAAGVAGDDRPRNGPY